MKKSKLLSVMSLLLVAGILASACSKEETKKKSKKSKDDEEIEEIEDDDEEETKKTKKTKKTEETEDTEDTEDTEETEEPTESTTEETTESTTEETTEETTEAFTDDTSDDVSMVPVDGMITYSCGNMQFNVPEEWITSTVGMYQYFFYPDTLNRSFMMFYTQELGMPMDEKTFAEFADMAGEELIAQLDNGVLISTSSNTDGPVYYVDVLGEGAMSGIDVTMSCRYYIVPQTGTAYCASCFVCKEDDANKDEILGVFQDTLDSATFA